MASGAREGEATPGFAADIAHYFDATARAQRHPGVRRAEVHTVGGRNCGAFAGEGEVQAYREVAASDDRNMAVSGSDGAQADAVVSLKRHRALAAAGEETLLCLDAPEFRPAVTAQVAVDLAVVDGDVDAAVGDEITHPEVRSRAGKIEAVVEYGQITEADVLAACRKQLADAVDPYILKAHFAARCGGRQRFAEHIGRGDIATAGAE